MSGYDTNLAAEYHVLSCLHRRGLTANLTLGNKKGVDVVVVREAGDAVTVEVKGVAKKYDWPANNLVTQKPDQHFVALVSFEGRIDEPRDAASSRLDRAVPRCGTVQAALPGTNERVSRCGARGGQPLRERVAPDRRGSLILLRDPVSRFGRPAPRAAERPWSRPGQGDGMERVPDWRGGEVDVAVSAGGVRALASPWDNMVRTGVSPWPPPELLQKVYESDHGQAFVGADHTPRPASSGSTPTSSPSTARTPSPGACSDLSPMPLVKSESA